MFGIGIVEIFLVFVVALFVIGPERMPEVARYIGKMVRQVQQFFAEIRNEVKFDDAHELDPFTRPDFPEDDKR